MKNKITLGLVSAAALLAFLPSIASAALTESQIQAILSLLQSFGADQTVVSNVNNSLRGLPTTSASAVSGTQIFCPNLTYNLYLGLGDSDTGGQVSELQKFLAQDSSVYPEGTITGFFGPLTEQAVQRWQAKQGIVSSGSPDTNGYGVVGSRTREKMRASCGSVAVPVSVPTEAIAVPTPAIPSQTVSVPETQTQFVVQPMTFKDISAIVSVNPSTVANLGFGVYQVSAQYNLGAYHQGKWYEGLNPNVSGPVWVEFNWPNTPDVDVSLKDENGNTKNIFLPAVGANSTGYGWYYWIAEDGSSYYANTSHGPGWPNLTSVEALKPEHLARKAGVIVSTTVSEQVKCIFKGSIATQECVSSTYSYGCKGTDSCTADVKGQKGEQLTWKSSCGGYAYTTIDGVNEYANFSCATTQPYITVLSPNGGESWQKGSTQIIKWNYYGVSRVYIKLRKGSDTYLGSEGAVSNIILNEGFYKWTIPSTLPDGNDYAIRVINADNLNVLDDSDSTFSIVALQQSYPGFYLKTDKPSYTASETVSLTLSRADGKTDPYTVDLYAISKNAGQQTLIHSNLQVGQNTFEKVQLSAWPIFTQGGTGDYFLAVCPAGCKYGSDSNTNSTFFTIVLNQTANVFEVVKPLWWPSSF